MKVKKEMVWLGRNGRLIPVKNYSLELTHNVGEIIKVNGTEKKVVKLINTYELMSGGYDDQTQDYNRWGKYYITENIKNGHSDKIYECEIDK